MPIGSVGNDSFDQSGLHAVILTQFSDPTPNGNFQFNEVVGVCRSLGIKTTFMHLESFASQPASSINESYDFIVIPQLKSPSGQLHYSTEAIDNALITIPVVGMHAGGGIGLFGSSPGIDTSTISASARRWISSKYWSNGCAATTTRCAALTTGEAIISISQTDFLTGAAIPEAGYVSVWYFESNSNPRYGSYANSSAASLYFILRDMADRSLLDLSGVIQPAIGVDIDHTNNTSQGERDLWFPLVGANAVSGIADNGGGESSCETGEGVVGWPPSGYTRQQVAWLQESAASGNEFSYHTHQQPEELTGTWPLVELGGSLAYNDTKANIDARYAEDDAQLSAKTGIHLSAKHYNPGSNVIGELTAQLFTPDTAAYADANNAVTKAGKGYRTFRNTSGSSAFYPGKPYLSFLGECQNRTAMSMCGIHIVWANQIVVGAATINAYATAFNTAMWSLIQSPTLIYTHPFYFCEADGYYGQDPWTLLREIYDSLGFVRYFAHVADEFPRIDVSLA